MDILPATATIYLTLVRYKDHRFLNIILIPIRSSTSINGHISHPPSPSHPSGNVVHSSIIHHNTIQHPLRASLDPKQRRRFPEEVFTVRDDAAGEGVGRAVSWAELAGYGVCYEVAAGGGNEGVEAEEAGPLSAEVCLFRASGG